MLLKIAHLYGNLLNTYGDNGNLLMFQYHAKLAGFTTETTIVSLGDEFNAFDYDFIFFGGGQDLEQSVVAIDLQTKKASLKEYIENNGVMLAICGGYQLLGHYYVNTKNEKIMGASILDLTTETQVNHRFIGDTKIVNDTFNETYVGFENHAGKTYLGNGLQPLGRVIDGMGNNGEDQTEGCHHKNVYCSYFHGPLLVRNPHLAKRLVNDIIKQKTGLK